MKQTKQKSISPISWFINQETMKHYFHLMDNALQFARQTQFKNECRRFFEHIMYGTDDSRKYFYLTKEDLDSIYRRTVLDKQDKVDL